MIPPAARAPTHCHAQIPVGARGGPAGGLRSTACAHHRALLLAWPAKTSGKGTGSHLVCARSRAVVRARLCAGRVVSLTRAHARRILSPGSPLSLEPPCLRPPFSAPPPRHSWRLAHEPLDPHDGEATAQGRLPGRPGEAPAAGCGGGGAASLPGGRAGCRPGGGSGRWLGGPRSRAGCGGGRRDNGAVQGQVRVGLQDLPAARSAHRIGLVCRVVERWHPRRRGPRYERVYYPCAGLCSCGIICPPSISHCAHTHNG